MLDITTSHNIVVSLELASTGQRILATILDLIFLLMYSSMVSLFASFDELLAFVLIFPMIFAYHLISEAFMNGQSLGKKAIGIRVISLNGEIPSIRDLTMRWMFRLVDITFSLGMLAMMFISSGKNKQRIGDILAKTTVVKVKNEDFKTLNSIREIRTTEEVDIQYPAMAQYADSDMLIVKDLLTRLSYPLSDRQRSLLDEVSLRISKDLKLKKVPANKPEFLKQVLREYIILTR